jgi:hypothetical protein
MSSESNDDRTQGTAAQLAIGASDIIPLLRRTNNALAACRRKKCVPRFLWDDGNNRPRLQIHKLVSV